MSTRATTLPTMRPFLYGGTLGNTVLQKVYG